MNTSLFHHNRKFNKINAGVKELWMKAVGFMKAAQQRKFVSHAPDRSAEAKKEIVIFESFFGKQYSCNPRAIYEYLKDHRPDLEMYWSVDPRYTEFFKENNIPYTIRFTPRWFYLIFSAHFWVFNSRMPPFMPKPKHTTYLQTWHGTPLKKLAGDMGEVHMPATNTERYKKNFHRETSTWDYLISPNAYSTEVFRRAFRYDQPVIESGYPRNDYLYTNNNPQKIRQLKERLGIPLDKKVILYAPTWRDDQFYWKGHYRFNLTLDLERMQKEFGDRYVIILRMHYLVRQHYDLTPFEGFVYDFSNQGDVSDLYLISDMLITDYSSVFFDYANLNRPIIFFTYDIERYRDELRGFYFDIETQAPGPIVKTTDGVIKSVRQFENEGYAVPAAFQNFYERFCYLECGESTQRVVDLVF